MKNKRIDEVGAIGNIAGLSAGAKGAFKGAAAGKGVLGKIGGAIQGAKEGSAKKKGDWAVRQWARKLKVDFLRHSGATGDTPEAFKNFIDNAYKIDLTLPTGTSPAAPAPTAPQTPFSGTIPVSYGGGQYINQASNTTVSPTAPPPVAPPAPPSFNAGGTIAQNYPQQYNPAGYQAPVATAPSTSPAAPLPPAPANKPRMTTNSMDAISALTNLGYKSKQATAAVMSVATDPSMSTGALISAALKSMAPAVAAEGVISPRLGLYGDKSFTQLISEGAVILKEAEIDDWCRSAAQQLLTKYPWLLDASVKYKVGSPEFASYLKKMHDDYGYDFGGNRAPAPRYSAQNAQRGAPTTQQAPTTRQQTATSQQKIGAALKKCGLSDRYAHDIENILKKSASRHGTITDLTNELKNIGIDEDKFTRFFAALVGS